MPNKIQDELRPDEEYPLDSFQQEDKIIELASVLRENGMSVRESEALAVDSLENDVYGEKQNLKTLGRILDVDQSTIRSHFSNAQESVKEAVALSYMFKDTMPQRIIAQYEISSHRDAVDKVVVTLGRKYSYETDQPDPKEEEYVMVVSEYEDTGWKDYEYRGELVQRVTGRTKVLDQTNRLLEQAKSNTNPVHIIGELMYALNLPQGYLDPTNEYRISMTLINPLCSPEGPPEEHDTPPIVFGQFASVINRFEDSE